MGTMLQLYSILLIFGHVTLRSPSTLQRNHSEAREQNWYSRQDPSQGYEEIIHNKNLILNSPDL